jgi:hypothetical protein
MRGLRSDSQELAKWEAQNEKVFQAQAAAEILRAEIGVPNVKVFEQTPRSEALSEQIDQAAELDEHRKGRPG